MESLDGLNEQQRRTLNQYQSITHSHDIEEAEAIQNEYRKYYKDSLEGDQSTSASSSLLGHNRPMTERRRKSGLLSFFFWPFNLIWKIIWSLYSITARLFHKPITTNEPRHDPRSEADRFLRNFESTYGTIHPSFFEGSYTQALNTSKKESKYMMVILISEEHDDNDAFCRSILTSPELLDFLRHHKVIVWGGNIRYTEAFQVSNILEATTYPFIAIIGLHSPSSSVSLSNLKLSVIDRIEGQTNPTSIIRRFENVMARTESTMNRLRSEHQQREQEQRLREEQEQAYAESLRIDREREIRMQQERQEAIAREHDRLMEQRNRELYIRYLCQKISTNMTNPPENEKVTKISFRMADGSRAIHKFKGSDTLEDLYQFVEAYPYMEEYAHEPSINRIPDNYVHKYRFTIHSAFPRTEYQPDPTTNIANVKGLWPSATLIVDPDQDDDSDEEY
ncbi:hypothetical protein RMATCC62417_11005 [Rhizopus microsporus]|nr:hypothetical protein RMATCC62417_11005 [Rhizopus microsporus]